MLERLGIGIDIVEIERFSNKPYETNKNFYQKIFHDSEITNCLERKNYAECFAGKFAIKESVIKSLPISLDFLDIVINYSNSKPIVTLLNNSHYSFLVSLTHEKLYAVSVVISEEINS
ncbi:holo-ACP synthase [Nitrosopumilus adriaticus]|uniref:holo-ACP synthase n=1 Tax=Nitrosopumilus adriaticus TaxID=1580092 RepID=UPI00352C4E23